MKIKAKNAISFVKHLEILAKLSREKHPGIYALSLYEQLLKLEKKAHRITTAQCNGEGNEEAQEKQLEAILTKVNSLLKVKTAFINGDPRGYALKIKEHEAKEIGIYQDWGGYGILAPEF